MQREQLIPLAQWAAEQKISTPQARKMAAAGEVLARKLGHHWFVVRSVERPEPTGETYTLFTHAGGAGKTSLARDLGFELATRGRRVLLIDADPQANLTAWLGVDPDTLDEEETLLRVVRHGVLPRPRNVHPNLDLLPANLKLARADVEIQHRPLGVLALRGALEQLEGYDLVLVDSPPSLVSLAVMAALAGDGLLVPVETGAKGLLALRDVVEVARDYHAALRKADPLAVPGRTHLIRAFIPTKYDARTSGDNRVLDALDELKALAPVAPRIAYRPGPHRKATEEQVPIQLTGDQEAGEEIARLANFLVEAVLAKEEVTA